MSPRDAHYSSTFHGLFVWANSMHLPSPRPAGNRPEMFRNVIVDRVFDKLAFNQ